MMIDLSTIKMSAERASPVFPGDYINPSDGFLCCGKCGTQKETSIDILGIINTVRCMCKCELERDALETTQRQERERLAYIKRLRINCFQDKMANDCIFDKAVSTPTVEKCRRYFISWDQMYSKGIGMLLWGNTGTGKTFAASCIANALIDQGVSVMVTNFPRILSGLTGVLGEEKNLYLDSLTKYKLLVIDDLGAERNSSFGLEQVFSVIDTRYRNGQPTIFTTNLTLEEMKNPASMEYRRIYERVLEMCVPVHFTGENFRHKKAAQKLQTARELFE